MRNEIPRMPPVQYSSQSVNSSANTVLKSNVLSEKSAAAEAQMLPNRQTKNLVTQNSEAAALLQGAACILSSFIRVLVFRPPGQRIGLIRCCSLSDMARINYSNADRQEASRPHQQSRFPFHGFSRSVGSLWRSLFADGSLKRVLSN